ncbi:MAG: hypothetical protein HY332_22805 [Chloroflexi bacterium]|nr:hypothetical protein [Chloroflexota bacterium]
MIGLLRRLRAGIWLPRPQAIDFETDHGHRPYGAWEAELAAYARLRTGVPIAVQFSLVTEGCWDEVIHLARPPGHLPPAEAFANAEVELEHLLTHHRHGVREVTLLWRVWSRPNDEIRLPWEPWNAFAVPAPIIRDALAAAHPDLVMPRRAAEWSQRNRDAAVWVAATWADGVDRALDIAARPGLADRLAPPAASVKATRWEELLLALAPAMVDHVALPADLREAVSTLAGTDTGDLRQIPRTLDVVEQAARLKLIPPAHLQRPTWLRPAWGRWRHAAALQRALEEIARSPATAAIAAATAQVRASLAGPLAARTSPWDAASSAVGRVGGHVPPGSTAVAATTTLLGGSRAEEVCDKGNNEWGPQRATAVAPDARDDAAHEWGRLDDESLQNAHAGLAGAGAGALGALHVISATSADRAAYWQLRGALAPEIESLVARLRAASDDYYAHAPRRFQRSGRIDRNRLPAALTGREHVFVKLIQEPEPAHALYLLLDCSASMVPWARQLREVAILAEAACAAVGAHVTAFAFGPEWVRMEPPAEGAPLVALGRKIAPHGGTPFGPAVALTAEWLGHQPYEQKRLWVFTDGQWSAHDQADSVRRTDLLKDVLVWVLGDHAPEPPVAEMRIAAIPTLREFVLEAPKYYWKDGNGAAPRRYAG